MFRRTKLQHHPLSRFIRTVRKMGFVFGTMTLVIIGSLAINSLLSLIANGEAVTHTIRINQELDKVSFFLIDAETNERGYLITGNESYIQEYQKMAGSQGLDGQIQNLRSLCARDPELLKYLDILEPLVQRRIAEMQEAIKERRLHGLNAARTVVIRNFANKTTDRIRHVANDMDDDQTQRLRVQTDRRDAGAQRSVLHVLAGGILATGILAFSSGLLRHEIIQRRRSEETVRRLNNELEERVQERTQHLDIAQQQIKAYARDLELVNIEMLERLAHAGEFRDDDTGLHTQRVGTTSGL
ncbi:MAG: hypothetical protein EOP10_22470, partial [Proteobacteria bacterium]